jgi:hypothetical protein
MLCQVEDVENDIVQSFAVRKGIGLLFMDRMGADAQFIYYHFIFARKSPAVITFTMLLILSVKKCASPVKK